MHDHLTEVYKGEAPKPNLGPPVGDVQAFTEDELDVALSQMRSNKSVGCDATSKELLAGVVEVEAGK